MRTRPAFSLFGVAVLLAACRERPLPTAPPEATQDVLAPLFAISDGAHRGGNPNFFFLPPLQPSPRGNRNFDRGRFNPNLSPTVQICDGRDSMPRGECANPLKNKSGTAATFRAVRGWDGLPDWVDPEQYHVLWQTRDYRLVADGKHAYRILVRVGSTLLGYLDIVPTATLLSALRISVGGQDVGWLANLIVPIRFRIEQGALCANPQQCAEVQVTSKGGDFTLSSKYAALSVPAGAVKSRDTVTVVVEKESPQYNGRCLPTNIVQSMGCYHFRSEPALYQFVTPVRMEACVDVQAVPPQQQDSVVLYKYNTTQGLQKLTPVMPTLIDCTTFTAMANPAEAPPSNFAAGALRRLGQWASRLFGPRPLYASLYGGVPTGVGGLGGSFSDVGGAVPSTATQDTVHLTVPASATVGDTGLRATASGGSGTGAFSYASSTPQVCTVGDTTGGITALAPGLCSLTVTKAADDVYRAATASGSFTVMAHSGAAGSVLIDASRDGGVWWSPQAGPFDPAAPHQGKALADALRSRGYVVNELGRGVRITDTLLSSYQIVVRAGYYVDGGGAAYSSAELGAYQNFLARGAGLLLEEDHDPPTDSLALKLGLYFTGSLSGSVSLISDSITSGTDSLSYLVGSYLTSYPSGAKVLGTVSGQPVMGTLGYTGARVFFIGDANTLENVPQPLVTKLFQWLATGTSTAFSCSSVTEISPAECAALVALYNATGGPSWTDHTGWLQTNTPCSTPWFGVWCPNGQPFSSLLLGRNNLTGTIPAQIGDLPNLQSLGLYVNHLSGPIPATLGRLGYLKYLDLQQNQLSGLIPVELGSLDSLTDLFLNSNLLAGHIPDTLGSLSHLQTLRLDQNQLSGGIPAALGNLSSLQAVYLRSNLLAGSVPLGVAQLGGRLGSLCDFAGNQVYVPDTPEYRAADVDGDGYICALPFTALFLPDLTITSAATITPASPIWGQSFTVDVTVGNVGQANAGAFQMGYELGCTDCGIKPDSIFGNVPGLEIGAEATLRIVVPSCKYPPGSYYIKIWADAGNVIQEANEYNNIITTYFTIGSGQSGACGGAP